MSSTPEKTPRTPRTKKRRKPSTPSTVKKRTPPRPRKGYKQVYPKDYKWLGHSYHIRKGMPEEHSISETVIEKSNGGRKRRKRRKSSKRKKRKSSKRKRRKSSKRKRRKSSRRKTHYKLPTIPKGTKFKKGPKKYKYTAILPNGKRVNFGHRDYQHYRDRVPKNKGGKLWTHLNHNDRKRMENYRSRHRGVKTKNGTPAYKKKYSASWFSYHYLW